MIKGELNDFIKNKLKFKPKNNTQKSDFEFTAYAENLTFIINNISKISENN